MVLVKISKSNELVKKKIGTENINELVNLYNKLIKFGIDSRKIVIGGGLAASILTNLEDLKFRMDTTDIDICVPQDIVIAIKQIYGDRLKPGKIIDKFKVVLDSKTSPKIQLDTFNDVEVLKITNKNVEIDILIGILLITKYIKIPLDEEIIKKYIKEFEIEINNHKFKVNIINEKLALFTQLLLLTGIDKQDYKRVFRILLLLRKYPKLREFSTIDEFFELCRKYCTNKQLLAKQFRLIFQILYQHKWRKYFEKTYSDWYYYLLEKLIEEASRV